MFDRVADIHLAAPRAADAALRERLVRAYRRDGQTDDAAALAALAGAGHRYRRGVQRKGATAFERSVRAARGRAAAAAPRPAAPPAAPGLARQDADGPPRWWTAALVLDVAQRYAALGDGDHGHSHLPPGVG